ncbi:MAG TPA: RDD family protein [Saprospiraceae bacterium]|nr:RDD family protein [Saprospiraceae bacterium]
MDKKKTPLEIEGISDSLYAGFWIRVGSVLLDSLFLLPFIILILYGNGLGKNFYFYTIIPNLAFGIWYHIYLPKKYGGTPGKLVAGIKIIRLDGDSIGWTEAFLRHSVMLALTILSSIWMTTIMLRADDETYMSISWVQRSQYLMTLSPDFFDFHRWASNIWIYSEFIVLMTNKRKSVNSCHVDPGFLGVDPP